ncbi:LacI family DNA-binding transcriptional regulator [Paradesertivirga mongoliensis]|uniref:LacI family DNA-binding transcriptional regulator n=1 Tax=Paradesertivirga mongoliensis TaxID=2100740 RepID=A0ABW4ZQI8_9SPHI|nr:LacI family DNA-binding transcriptional regulator [Pedobacter mongoliensis]
MKRVTINDIARELNITAATVSRALSDHPEISSGTKKIVKETALRLDYSPNKVASSLRSGKTNIIGVIIPTAEHIFFGSVIHGISNAASKNGYEVLIYQSNESEQFEKKGIDAFINARVDGILASIAKDTKDFSHFSYVKEKNIPIAFFDRFNDNLGISSVCIDDYRGAFLAVETLVNEGYNRIAYISGPLHIKTFSERVRGYKDALEHYNLDSDPELIYPGDISIESGRKAIKKFFKLDNKPDAVCAVEDFTALGALKELKEMGVNVPEEFGVIGFCNDLFGEHISPSLSTVDQQTVAMGEEAFDLINKLINNEPANQRVHKKVLEPLIIIRESSKRT